MSDVNGKTVVMGLQQTFVMFGATVLVPLITGLDVGVTLFCAGIGTWIFHFLTGFKVPVFLGSSFAFMPGILAVAAAKDGGGLPAALGGIVIAGAIYIIVALIFTRVSYKVLERILPPQVTGPMIILIGLMLADVAIKNADGSFAPGAVKEIGVNGCWLIALFTFAVGVFVKVYFDKIGKRFISALPVLIAVVSGYLLSAIVGIVDFSGVSKADWVGLPNFTLPVFEWSAISIIVPIAFVTLIEHFGDVIAVGNVVGKDFLKEPGIHRTMTGDGIATSFAALIGGPANTTYSENTGALALTGNHNPVIMRIAACLAILLAMIPKFTAIIAAIPAPVIGGISILLFGMITSIGIKNMIDNKVDMNNAKNLIIVAAMLVLGIGKAEFAIDAFKLSGLGLAAIVGILLNLILNFGFVRGK